jgi:PPM family protein phosphatase
MSSDALAGSDTLVLLRPSVPPVVRSCGISDRGRVRATNEDHFLIAEIARTLWVHNSNLLQKATQFGRNRGHLFLVADGMGGHQAGETASALGVASVEEYVLHILKKCLHFQTADEAAILKEFQSALQQADARLCDEAADHPEFAGMGTTVTLAFVSGWKLFVVHAGDSRCYLFRGGRLEQLTEDHTVTAELVRQGVIEPGDVKRHRYRHVLTNVVGGGSLGVRVDVQRLDLEAGDVVLLCSDGLTEMLSVERIAAVLSREEPTVACEKLVAEANHRGGRDNVTIVIARFDAPKTRETSERDAARAAA